MNQRFIPENQDIRDLFIASKVPWKPGRATPRQVAPFGWDKPDINSKSCLKKTRS
jgi:hypothetical protein